MSCVIAPPAHGAGVDGLSGLPDAGGGYGSRICLRPDSLGAPLEAQVRLQRAHAALRLRYDLLVADLLQPSRQERLPDIHEALVAGIESRDIPEVVGVVVARVGEVLEIDRETGIQRVAPAMDDGCLREQQRDEADMHEIEGILVEHQRLARMRQ